MACKRCHRDDAPPLAKPPFPGELGAELTARVCADCWAEWQKVEFMVINDLRLNFMDPRSQEILEQHMREFLGLAPAAETPAE